MSLQCQMLGRETWTACGGEKHGASNERAKIAQGRENGGGGTDADKGEKLLKSWRFSPHAENDGGVL